MRNILVTSSLLLALLSGNASAKKEVDPHANHIRAHPVLQIYQYEAADTCDESISQVRINIIGGEGGGILAVELYNDPEHFLNKKGRVKRVRVPATSGTQRVCMNEDRLGSYAVAAYHDMDANRKLKKKWNGAPREPFALSRNPKVKELRFPKFSESAFDLLTGGTEISIELIDLKKQKKARKAARKAAQ